MQELIVVGMRFSPAYAESKVTIGDTLKLVLEPTNKTNKNAVAVYYVSNAILLPRKIGYIRDADLHKVDKTKLQDWPDSSQYGIFAVDRICTNYLRIVEQVVVKTNPCKDIDFGLKGEFIFADTEKNANKHFCDTSDGPMTYAEHDIMVQNYDKEIIDRIARKQADDQLKNFNTYQKPKEEKKMINTNAMRDSFFKEVKNVAMDMQTGKLGVVTRDGIITATDDGVSVNPITEMGFNIPAFAMRVPVEQLVKGDIIIGSGDPVFFVEGSKVGYMTITTNGVIQETGSVANMFFGKNTVMAVKNMFGGGGDTAGGMNPMMLMAMMGDEKEGAGGFDFKKMMVLQMCMGGGQSGGGMGQMNPMVLAMMMGKK